MNLYFYTKIKEYTFHITVAIILVATVILGGHFALAAETSATEVNYSSYLAQGKAESISNLNLAAKEAGLKDVPLGTRVGTIINGVLSIIGVVMLVLFIYGGWTWMTAGGNEEKVRQATKILASAVVGFILIFLSYALTNFFASQFFPVYTQPPGINGEEPGGLETGACITTNPVGCIELESGVCNGYYVGDGTTCAEVCYPPVGNCSTGGTCYICAL